MSKSTVERRDDYSHFLVIPTRWKDVDMYHHVNNVIYYSYFDTVICEYLMGEGELDPVHDDVIGICAESMCRYLHELTFPEHIDAGLRVAKLGRSSVRYEIGLFRQGSEEPAATGYFVHVFVNRATKRSTAIPTRIRTALQRIAVPGASA